MKTEAAKPSYPANGQTNPRTGVRVWIVVEQNGNERVWLETPKNEPILRLA